MIDGEAVMLGLDGISDFNALHSDKQNEEVQLCTFDILAIGADDLRNLPLIGESDHRMVNSIGFTQADFDLSALEFAFTRITVRSSVSYCAGGVAPPLEFHLNFKACWGQLSNNRYASRRTAKPLTPVSILVVAANKINRP